MIAEMNVDIFRMINDLGKEFPTFNPVFIFLAEYMVYFLALGVIIFWFTKSENNKMMIICGVVAFVLAKIFAMIAGMIHQNNQPFVEVPHANQLIEHAIDNSFPSDHTIMFFAFCMSFWLFKKNFRYIWLLLAVVVSISRIWVGVHYPVDVFVGAVIGIVSAIIAYQVIPRLDFVYKLIALYERAESAVIPGRSYEQNRHRRNR